MKAVQIPGKGKPLELVEMMLPDPGPGQVRVKIEACGVCHGDTMAIEGRHPLLQYPRIPGHEVIGTIDKVGADVSQWHLGQRVGIGWSGGQRRITGLTYDGGYAEYMLAFADAMAEVPKELTPTEAAPLTCAGITTFSAIRSSKARPGDVVAILGIGGLGHLAIQYARAFGLFPVAISRGKEKEALSRKLGSVAYIDSDERKPGDALRELGDVQMILATAPNSALIGDAIRGLAVDGELIVVSGSDEHIPVSPGVLLNGRRTVRGWTSRDPNDLKKTLDFSAKFGIRPMVELFSLDQASIAFNRMLDAEVRFRAVFTVN
ncbi:MAG: alcohol dehydrogenase [Sulfobacillus benefaciens]|uniref:alcohol dehydrogenase n=1 Tax=Sulfobacillus benefaciens TaxID=453960 RepID=A0A2T2XC30_9FIRM|nr:MAG: alcohol dehydrogenase [Sulfobacillus benefaciens]